jgi:hypothetical protein
MTTINCSNVNVDLINKLAKALNVEPCVIDCLNIKEYCLFITVTINPETELVLISKHITKE